MNTTKSAETRESGDRVPASGAETGAMKAPRTAPADTGHLEASLARIERRQTAHEQVALRLVDMLAIHNEKLDAILEAATREPGPSPVLGVLADILDSLRAQENLLAALPDTLAETIRDEGRADLDTESDPDADDPEMEPAAPGLFDNRTGERH